MVSRLTLWVLASVTGLVLLFGYHTSTAGPLEPDATGSSTRPVATTFVGDRVRVRDGMVQVRIVIAGGRLTAVEVPLYPTRTPRSRRAAEQAIPVLVRRTLAAQGPEIDTVRGAAATSNGYRRSLRSALAKAGFGTATDR